MSMDGRFIEKLADELNSAIGFGRINKIYQLSKSDFLFVIRSGSKTESLYLSLSPQIARIQLTDHIYDKPLSPTGFCMLLRKYLENGQIKKIAALNGDRIIRLDIENNNDFGEKIPYGVIIELMGKHANLVIVDDESTIIDCFKHVSPFEGQQRTFLKGFKYELPEDGKINANDSEAIRRFFDSGEADTAKALVDHVRGISPLLADHLFHIGFNQTTPLYELYRQLLKMPIEPVIAEVNGKQKFYWFNIFEDENVKPYPTLSKVLDEIYFEAGQLDRTKQVSKYIYQLIKREYDKNRDKLEKLTQELEKAKNNENFRIKGDLIIANQHEMSKGMNEFQAFSYETGTEVKISLDRLSSPMENAQAYYKKYKKTKSSINHLIVQIKNTEDEINYFELLLIQIETASLNDLNEITEELKQNKYLHEKPTKVKKTLPHYDTYFTPSGTEIVVGKNNLQNEYITHHLGKHFETWFHTKDIPGSHVLVRKAEALNEEDIRTAANLAAFYSKAKESSSVPVDYTLLKFVKKIPGIKGSFVTYSHQKTIFIDPSKEAIALLKNKRQ
jgi:predicted ribosome quality control (RQC) complex YloA/Tae2 family protein